MPHSISNMRSHAWFDYDTGSTYLGISRRALQRVVTSGKIGFTRLGLRTLFSQEQLDAYIESCTVEPKH
jgi:excisionase family DNA binding protein